MNLIKLIERQNQLLDSILLNMDEDFPQDYQGQISEEQAKALGIVDLRFKNAIYQFIKETYSSDNIILYDVWIKGENVIDKMHGVMAIRNLVSKITLDNQVIINYLKNKQIITIFFEMIQQIEFPQLRRQALWAIVNGCGHSEDCCLRYVNEGVIPILLYFTGSSDLSILQLVIWSLGNIAANDAYCCKNVFDCGGVALLLDATRRNVNNSQILEKGCWALTNLCKVDLTFPYQLVKDIIAFCLWILTEAKIMDSQILAGIRFCINFHLDQQIVLKQLLNVISLLLVRQSAGSYQFSIIRPFLRKTDHQLIIYNQVMKHKEEFFEMLINQLKLQSGKQQMMTLKTITTLSKHVDTFISEVLHYAPLVSILLSIFKNGEIDEQYEICKLLIDFINKGQPDFVSNFLQLQSTKVMQGISKTLQNQKLDEFDGCILLYQMIIFVDKNKQQNEANMIVESAQSERLENVLQSLIHSTSQIKSQYVSRIQFFLRSA